MLHSDLETADFALLCLSQQAYELALYYFQLAVKQSHADAMHYLSRMYEAGEGVEQSPDMALAWRTKAAAFGHKIARAQLDAF